MSRYHDHAYDRAILAELQRHLSDRFIASETPAKDSLTCPEVFYHEAEVPQDAFVRIQAHLQRWEALVRDKMRQYEWRRKGDDDPMPFLQEAMDSDDHDAPEEDVPSEEPAPPDAAPAERPARAGAAAPGSRAER